MEVAEVAEEVVVVDEEVMVVDPLPVPVKVLHKEGLAALVQWVADDGSTGRAIIPITELKRDGVSPLTLAAGMPGGEPWSEIDGIDDVLEQEFYQRGIWEPEDMLQLSHLAQQAIQQVLVVPLKKRLLEYSKRVSRR